MQCLESLIQTLLEIHLHLCIDKDLVLIRAVLNLVLHGIFTVKIILKALLRVSVRFLIERFLEGVDGGERLHALRISDNSARPPDESAI